MLKAYKYRIYPNNEQKVQIEKTFGCCRFVYNQTLAYRKERYEKEKKSVSKTDCNNFLYYSILCLISYVVLITMMSLEIGFNRLYLYFLCNNLNF